MPYSSSYGKKAALLSDPSHIRYLTGFVGSDTHEIDAYLFVYGPMMVLFTNSLYLEQAINIAKHHDMISVSHISRDKPLATNIHSLVKDCKVMEVTVDETLPLFVFLSLRKHLPKIKISVGQPEVSKRRSLKTNEELTHIRKAVAVTDTVFTSLLGIMRPGITERYVYDRLNMLILKRHADIAFRPIVAFGAHASMPHYTDVGSTKLGKHDFILLDFGAKIHGYCADMTRMVFCGTPNATITKAYQTVLTAQEKALSVLSSAKIPSGAKADRAAKAVIARNGFPPYSHSLGHNIGLDVHESPRLTVKKDAIIKPGMVFSIEPGIYVPGTFGIRIEDLVYYSPEGFEILTKSTKEMIILKS